MSDDLLNHPEVLKTIRFELLRGGYPQYRIDDGIQAVLLEMCEYLPTLPAPITTVDRMKAVVRTPAYRHGVDWVRDQINEREVMARVGDETESRNAQQPSLEQQMELSGALDVIERGKKGRDGELLEGIKKEESDRETAERTGRKNEQVRQDKATMRKRARLNLKAAGYLGGGIVVAIAGIALIVFWLRGHVNDDEAHRHQAPPAPSATTPPEPPPQVPVTVGPSDADRQKAAELRAHAHAARLKKQWYECGKGYEAADALDPKGGGKTAEDDIRTCALEMMGSSKP